MLWGPQDTEAQRGPETRHGHTASQWKSWDKDPGVLAPRLIPGWGHADGGENCGGQAGGQASDSREGGAAEDAQGNGARQVAGLPAVSVPEVEGVQGLEVIGVSLQLHLAQELILQDSVVPDLDSDGLAWLFAVEDAFYIVLRRRGTLLHG